MDIGHVIIGYDIGHLGESRVAGRIVSMKMNGCRNRRRPKKIRMDCVRKRCIY